jgi:hypothetical protein
VAFFFKQWGGRTPKAGGNRLDGRSWRETPKLNKSNWGSGWSRPSLRYGT